MFHPAQSVLEAFDIFGPVARYVSGRALHKQEFDLPFRRIALLLHLCEYTFCFVIRAMTTLGHLAIALYLLLPAHIACSCNPSSLRVVLVTIVVAIHVVIVL